MNEFGLESFATDLVERFVNLGGELTGWKNKNVSSFMC